MSTNPNKTAKKIEQGEVFSIDHNDTNTELNDPNFKSQLPVEMNQCDGQLIGFKRSLLGKWTDDFFLVNFYKDISLSEHLDTSHRVVSQEIGQTEIAASVDELIKETAYSGLDAICRRQSWYESVIHDYGKYFKQRSSQLISL